MSVVYALVDPLSPSIYRYIGKTKYGIAKATIHARKAKDGDQSPRSAWIRSLLDAGRNYKVIVLEEPPPENLNRAWLRWIVNKGDASLSRATGRSLGKIAGSTRKTDLTSPGRTAGISELGGRP